MDTEKIGRFIAETRKDLGLTQRELADRPSISDKAVSKWERGKSLPDISVMQALCGELHISINDLLSGEKLSEDDFDRKAEENIMSLMEENKKQKESNMGNSVKTVIGLLAVFIVLFFAMIISGGLYSLANLIDIPSLIIVLSLLIFFIITSGLSKDFGRGFKILFKGASDYSAEQLKKAYLAQKYAARIIMKAGPIGMIVGLINFLKRFDDPSTIGPNIAVAALTTLYSFILSAIFLYVETRIRLLMEDE